MANDILKQIEFSPTCRPNPLSDMLEPQTIVRVNGSEGQYQEKRVLALNEKNRLGFRHNFWGFIFKDSPLSVSSRNNYNSISKTKLVLRKEHINCNCKSCSDDDLHALCDGKQNHQVGNSGFNVLLRNNVHGRQMCETVAKSLYERAIAEESFGKNLCRGGQNSCITTTTTTTTNISEFSSSASTVFTGAGVTMRPLLVHGMCVDPDIEGRGRIAFAKAIMNDLIPVIKCFVEEQRLHCQMIEDRMRKSCSRLDSSIKRAEKCHGKYKSVVRSFVRNFGTSGNGVFRSVRKLMSAEQEMTQYAEAYNQARDSWELEMFDCMQVSIYICG
jgi:hypothetical protein